MELEQYPLVVSTWPFIEAVRAAWKAVDAGSSAVDSVVEGCSTCEELRCDGTGCELESLEHNLDLIKYLFNKRLLYMLLCVSFSISYCKECIKIC